MPADYQQRLSDRAKPVTFKATLGLLGATSLGVGALMGAGLYVLVGIAAAAAGPALWIAYAVCGVLTALSVLMFADFARRVHVAGGGYVYAYRQLGSFWGFMVGWHLAVGSIFACALYAYGFSAYGASLAMAGNTPDWLLKVLSAGLVVVLILFGLRGGEGGDRIQRIFTWGNLLVIIVLVAVAVPLARGSRFTPMFPKGVGGIGTAISLIYISFFGYQLIANSAEEIKDASKTVPKAMGLSMLVAAVFYLLVALASVAAVDWKDLAASDAPLVVVASRGVGTFGAILIGVGGVLASVAALNSTLLSQGRQLYAMGRDRLLPELVGRVVEKSGVPAVALLAGAAVTLAVILLADLAFVAKAANFALLFSMLPVSVALDRLYRRRGPDDPPVPAWRRVVPWAALVANAGLLLTLDWQSLMFGGMMVGVGCAVFLSYSYSAEKRGQAGFSVALSDERGFQFLRRGERILVPMANPRTQESLFSISQALLPLDGGEIVVLTMIKTEAHQAPRDALRRMSGTFEAVGVLNRVNELAEARGVTFTPVVRAARSLADGIVDAAIEERCQMIVMGWATQDDGTPSQLLNDVVSRVKSDIIFLALSHDVTPRRIGVSLGAKHNLPLMVRVASHLAEQYQGEVTYFNVLPEYYGPEHLQHAREVQIEAITRHASMVPYRTELLRSANPLGAIVERSRELDLLVIGTAVSGPYGEEAVGTFSAMVAQQAHCSVMIVRATPSLNRYIPPPVEAIRDLGASFGRRRRSREMSTQPPRSTPSVPSGSTK